MSTLQDSLFDAMGILAESAAKKAQGAITIDCVITRILNLSTGKYEVDYLGNSLIVYAGTPNVQYKIGDKVYILVPDGDFSKQKVIISLSTPSVITYDKSEENNYIQVSNNFFGENSDEIKLCSYFQEEVPVFYDLNKIEDKEKIIKINNNFRTLFSNYSKNYSTFAFSAEFKTNLPIVQQQKGNYGLKLIIPVITAAGTEKNKIYVFDIDNISGNPYSLKSYSKQSMFIQFEPGEVLDDKKYIEIKAFVEDFPKSKEKEEEKIYDIFIKNLSFAAYDLIGEAGQTGYYLQLTATDGNYFFAEYEEERKTLTPILKINGKTIELNKANQDLYHCYWFMEDATIKSVSHLLYHPYGGIGWRCLNTRESYTENGEIKYIWLTNEYSYLVKKENVPYTARYKCVIIINDKNSNDDIISTPVTDIIKLENLNSIFSMSLTSFSKNTEEEKLELVFEIKDENKYYEFYPNASFSYYWSRYDKRNKYIEELDFVKEKDKTNFNQGFDLIEEKHKDNKRINRYILKINPKSIDEMNTLLCSFYINFTKDNIYSNFLLGAKSILITPEKNASYILKINNGDVLYKYDKEGDSPLSVKYDSSFDSRVELIKPLTYTIYKRDGSELTESEYAYCKAEWKVPKNSLLIPENKNDFDDYFYINEKIGHSNYIYGLASTYSFLRKDNTITLTVRFGDYEMTADAAIKIIKEGDSGTTLSNYTAVITHKGSAYGERAGDIYQRLQFVYAEDKNIWYYHNLNKHGKIEDRLKPMISIEDINTPSLSINIYRSGELIEDYSNISSIKWMRYGEEQTSNILIESLSTDFKVNILPKNEISWDDSSLKPPVNIVQAIVSFNDGRKIYAYYPIEVIRVDKFDDMIKVDENNQEITAIPSCIHGFSSILYDKNNKNPKYNSADAFICVDSVYNTENIYNTYAWSCGENMSLTEVKKDGKIIENKKIAIPNIEYNGKKSNYIQAKLTYSEEYNKNLHADRELQRDIINNNKLYQAELVLEKRFLENRLLENVFSNRVYISLPVLYDKYVNYAKPELKNSFQNFVTTHEDLHDYLEEIIETMKIIKDSYNYFTQHHISGRADLSFQLERYLNELSDIINYNQLLVADVRREMQEPFFREEHIYIDSHFRRIHLFESYSELLSFYSRDTSGVAYNALKTIKEKTDYFNITLLGYSSSDPFSNVVESHSPLGLKIHNFNTFKENIINFQSDINQWLGFFTERGWIDELENKMSDYFESVYFPLYHTLDTQLFYYHKGLKNFSLSSITEYGSIEDIFNTIIQIFSPIIATSIVPNTNTSCSVSLEKQNEFENRAKDYANKIQLAEDRIREINLSLTIGKYSITYVRPIVITTDWTEASSQIEGQNSDTIYTGTGNNYLDTPQTGSGSINSDTGFTGVVMGNYYTGESSDKNSGLFGFCEGVETIRLDSATGATIIGAEGKSQIIIEPGSQIQSGTAILKSGNYNTKDIVDDKGNIITPKGGMLIDLTNSEIRYGTGNFIVNKNGFVTIKNGGSIGGWVIGGDNLYTDMDIKDGRMILNSTGKLYSHSHDNFNSLSQGFYLGKDGFSIGNSIKINSTENGVIEIGCLGEKVWTVRGDKNKASLSYAEIGDDGSETAKVYVGTDKIVLKDEDTFSIDNQGFLTAKKGDLAGLKIDKTTLAAKDIIIDSKGEIYDKDKNWVLGSGAATFKKINITGEDSSIGGIKVVSNGIQSNNFNEDEGYKLTDSGDAIFYNIQAIGGDLFNIKLKNNLTLEGTNGCIKFDLDNNSSISYTNKGITIKGKSIYLDGSSSINQLSAMDKIKLVDSKDSKNSVELNLQKMQEIVNNQVSGTFIVGDTTITVTNGLITQIATQSQ